jgi:hypothetical protein
LFIKKRGKWNGQILQKLPVCFGKVRIYPGLIDLMRLEQQPRSKAPTKDDGETTDEVPGFRREDGGRLASSMARFLAFGETTADDWPLRWRGSWLGGFG